MALGRTLYRDADIYIFDEPNASLDLLTESEILKTIRQETKGKITFIIMHRFNTMVVHANNITVLENGKIAESGTHSQLINKQGIYAALFNQYHNIDELSVWNHIKGENINTEDIIIEEDKTKNDNIMSQ